jgi:hypothetical protein
MRVPARWRNDYQLWVEFFVLINFAFLIPDIWLAHSANQFRRAAEYLPLYFSMAATAALTVGILARECKGWTAVWRDLGYLVGWTSLAMGLGGVILHLQSQFFYEKTLRSLTYAAPFAAPLAYAGLGFLLLLNRMVDADSPEWPRWVLLLALGGFLGNFVLSLTDHAVNGFFRPVEWLPVASSAFAVGFLVTPFLVTVTRRFLALCASVLVVQAAVGVLGFFLHAAANLPGRNFINGAPPLAPLLFPNMVVLGLVALWVLWRRFQ